MANAMANANANANANENEKYKTQFEREPIKCLQFILDTDLLCATHVYGMFACVCVCVWLKELFGTHLRPGAARDEVIQRCCS